MASIKIEDRIKERELQELLESVRGFAETTWAVERLLPSFTDHGPDHTFRVIARIEEFLQDTRLLSEDEAFVLLAACWLHDICMQDYGLLEETNARRYVDEPLSADEQRLIRTNHASRIREALYQDHPIVLRGDRLRRQSWELPRLGNHKRYIAEVACGHSTSGFQRAKNIPYDHGPRGRGTFRTSMLAALLLVGDECDLDHSRAEAIDNAGVKRLHPISVLHHLKHRYVSRSRIIVAPDDLNARQLEVVYNWPEDNPVIEGNYRRWIEGKLLAQINLVQPILSRELGISFHISRPFRIQETEISMRVEKLPEHVLPFLDAERVRMDLADLEDNLQEIMRALRNTSVHILIEPTSPGSQGAREVALLAISELLAQPSDNGHQPCRQVEIDAADDPTCTDPPALLERIFGFPSASIAADLGVGISESGWWLWDGLREALRQRIVGAGPLTILLCNAHVLPVASKQLLAHVLIPVVRQYEKIKLFVTTDSTKDLIIMPDDGIKILEMPMVSRKDVLELLDRHTLYPVTLRERHLRDRELFTQTDALSVAAMLAPEK